MRQRFARASENDTGQVGQALQAVYHTLERIHRHLGFGVVPDVADAGAAMEITFDRRL